MPRSQPRKLRHMAMRAPAHHHRPSTLSPLRQERNLCAAERYLPAQYLAIKAAILKQQELKGRVPRNDILKLPFKVLGRGTLRGPMRAAVLACLLPSSAVRFPTGQLV